MSFCMTIPGLIISQGPLPPFFYKPTVFEISARANVATQKHETFL